MKWYPRPYTRQGVQHWIARSRERYASDGFALWAVEWLQDGTFVGDCGLVKQVLEDEQVVEVGYHILPAWQGRGIATEAASACRDYARDVLRISKLYAFVRPENEPSRRVAQKLGMQVTRRLNLGTAAFLHEIWAMDL